MTTCYHSQIMELYARQSGWALVHGRRVTRLLQELPNPSRQYPGILVFVGKKRKTVAMQAMFPSNNITRRQSQGIGHLHLDMTTHNSSYPLLLLDCGGPSLPPSREGAQSCHETFELPINWSDLHMTYDDVRAKVMAGLIFTFTDVVCVFVDDLGVIATSAMLAQWTKENSLTNGAVRVQLSLVLVSQAASRTQLPPSVRRAFHSIQILSYDFESRTSSSAACLGLKQVVLRAHDDARRRRERNGVLYDASTLPIIFMALQDHFSRSFHEIGPLELVRCPDVEDIANHIRRFAQTCFVAGRSEAQVAHCTAVSLFTDAYTRFFHPFESSYYYNVVYADCCTRGTKGLVHNPDTFSNLVQNQFISCFTDYQLSEYDIKNFRHHYLSADSTFWRGCKSHLTCFSCLCRSPEYLMDCGHTLCDKCVLALGTITPGLPYSFFIDDCLLCGTPNHGRLRVKPPTVDPCILAIDGGGVRGIVALEFLAALQIALGSPQVFQKYFDVAFGTSSAAVIVLDLFIHHSEIADATVTFINMARRCFPVTTPFWSPCTWLRQTIQWWLQDYRYEADNLDRVLQELFGSYNRLFDTKRTSANIYIGVTATTTDDARLCIFSNYNGARNTDDKGYFISRPERLEDEPLIWEVTWLLCSKENPGSGVFQDGGIRANNPLQVALWELEAIFPSTTRPSLALSIGTGFVDPGPWAENLPLQGILMDGFVPRLFRALMTSPSLHGQNSWSATMNGIDQACRFRYFRLNLPLTGPEPALDDVLKMTELQMQTRDYLENSSKHFEAARGLWASRFYFELTQYPAFFEGCYDCVGILFCRHEQPKLLVQSILADFPHSAFTLNDTQTLQALDQFQSCESCEYAYLEVHFRVMHLEECCSLWLTFDQQTRYPISGFPNSILWFINQQNLASCTIRTPSLRWKCTCHRSRP